MLYILTKIFYYMDFSNKAIISALISESFICFFGGQSKLISAGFIPGLPDYVLLKDQVLLIHHWVNVNSLPRYSAHKVHKNGRNGIEQTIEGSIYAKNSWIHIWTGS